MYNNFMCEKSIEKQNAGEKQIFSLSIFFYVFLSTPKSVGE